MNIAIIPESAPFNTEQRAWLNGFLAGWLGLDGAPTPHRPTPAARPLAVGPGRPGRARARGTRPSPGTTRPCRSTSG